MPQCVQNTFKNDLKMVANGQFRATYRRREPAYVNVRPRGLQVKMQSSYIWQNFVEIFYTLQITSFQVTKLVQNAFNINPKEDHIAICQIACGIFKSGTCLNESLKLSPWSELNSFYSIKNKSSYQKTQLASTYLRITRTSSMSFSMDPIGFADHIYERIDQTPVWKRLIFESALK